MAELLQYEQHIAPEGLPSVRVNTEAPAEAFGGGQANARAFGAIEGLQNETSQLLEHAKHQADDVKIQDAFAKTAALKNDLAWNPKTGAVSRKGEDLVSHDLVGEYMQKYKEGTDNIAKGLTNADQRAMYTRVIAHQGNHLNIILQRQFAAKSEKYMDDTTDSVHNNLINDVSLNYRDSDHIDDTRDKLIASWESYAGRKGLNEEQHKDLMNKVLSQFNRSMITSAIDKNDDIWASSFYKEHKKEFTSGDRDHVEKLLEIGSTKGESLRSADYIMSKYDDYQDQLDAVRKIKDPKIRDAVDQRINHMHQENKVAEEERIKDQYDNDWREVYRTKNIDSAINSHLEDYSPTQIRALKQAALVEDADTNPIEFNRLLEEFSNNSKGFQSEDIYSNDKLSSQDKTRFSQLQIGLAKKDQKTLQKQNAYGSDIAETNALLLQNGINPHAKLGEPDVEKANQFKDAINREVAAFEDNPANKGRPPTSQERSEIKRRLLTDIKLTEKPFNAFNPWTWFQNSSDSGKITEKMFQLKPGEKYEFKTIASIPPQFVAKARMELGKNVTDKQIVDYINSKE